MKNIYDVLQQYPFLLLCVCALLFIIGWFCSQIIHIAFNKFVNTEITKKEQEREALLEKQRTYIKLVDDEAQANQLTLAQMMENIYEKCYLKGYRTIRDTDRFFLLKSAYAKVGGNHYIDTLARDFEKIQLRQTIEIPIDEGFNCELKKDNLHKIVKEYQENNFQK